MALADLRAIPSRLADAARAFPLLPGRQVIRIRDGGEAVGEACHLLFENDRWEALVLIEAGDLGKRSSLRDSFERSGRAVALACYADEGETLRQLITETLQRSSLKPTPEALGLLTEHLGADRALTRRELEKLALYCGRSGVATADDVLAVIGDGHLASFAALAVSAAGGDVGAVNRAVGDEHAFDAIAAVRLTAQHLQRLHRVKAEMMRGRSAKEAMQALRPPVFFRVIEEFARQLRLWSTDALEAALVRLLHTEMACKQTGMPANALAIQALLEIASAASRAQAGSERAGRPGLTRVASRPRPRL